MENQVASQLQYSNQLHQQYQDILHEFKAVNTGQQGIIKDDTISATQEIVTLQTRIAELVHYIQQPSKH
jgi:deoxyadenosine/deoxycytidine kinase